MFGWFQNKQHSTDNDVELDLAEIDEAPEERREADREDVYADAVVQSHYGTCLNRAIILDISKTGARLRFTNNSEIDGVLNIKISRFRIERQAQPVWRSRTDVGIQFI